MYLKMCGARSSKNEVLFFLFFFFFSFFFNFSILFKERMPTAVDSGRSKNLERENEFANKLIFFSENISIYRNKV